MKQCDHPELTCVVLYEDWCWNGYFERLGIYRCARCRAYVKCRFQCDGTGRDDIILELGESKRGYTFTADELAEALATTRRSARISSRRCEQHGEAS